MDFRCDSIPLNRDSQSTDPDNGECHLQRLYQSEQRVFDDIKELIIFKCDNGIVVLP